MMDINREFTMNCAELGKLYSDIEELGKSATEIQAKCMRLKREGALLSAEETAERARKEAEKTEKEPGIPKNPEAKAPEVNG
jgi:hypothetical protein